MDESKKLTLLEEAVYAQTSRFTIDDIANYFGKKSGMWNINFAMAGIRSLLNKEKIHIVGFTENMEWIFEVSSVLEVSEALVEEEIRQSSQPSEELLEFIPMNVSGTGMSTAEKKRHNAKVREQRRRLGLSPDKREKYTENRRRLRIQQKEAQKCLA